MPEYLVKVEYMVRVSAKDAETAVNIAAEGERTKLEFRRAVAIKEGSGR
jgi:hypothetical protein